MSAAKKTDREREEIVEAVLAGLCEGRSVTETVKARKDWGVSPGTVRGWMLTHEAWMARYQEARKLMGNALAEEAVQVARESSRHSNAEDRLLIETLKWAASKANPAEYGDKQTVEHQGAQVLSVRIVEEDGPTLTRGQTERMALEAGVMALTTPLLPAQKNEDE